MICEIVREVYICRKTMEGYRRGAMANSNCHLNIKQRVEAMRE